MLLLAACGDDLKGTFEDEMGLTSLTFHGDGKVVQSSPLAAVEAEMRYEVDGDRIRLTNPEAGTHAALVLTRIDDDTLSGPMGFRYRRKK
ncbi:hypothetical protein LDO26_16745 [Luteimonas sp. BDR2-5]|uniref:hypothetical protein n=1 Tax=Proluteimonas luteida TaxID=2878685 RepID=UPI001E43711B|nr:hypothetical protein [Luteimonas sp. BDR2-5]MCD9029841.1 hypothetical protein [Luteimonas sp. BDR2-5]